MPGKSAQRKRTEVIIRLLEMSRAFSRTKKYKLENSHENERGDVIYHWNHYIYIKPGIGIVAVETRDVAANEESIIGQFIWNAATDDPATRIQSVVSERGVTGWLQSPTFLFTLEPGYHTARWDARNSSGSEVSSGIYIYRLTALPIVGKSNYAGIDRVKKMLLTK